jgi:hypothetical protein
MGWLERKGVVMVRLDLHDLLVADEIECDDDVIANLRCVPLSRMIENRSFLSRCQFGRSGHFT